MTSITPFLWFDNNVPEAVAFYKSVFPNAKVETVNDFMATFELEGQRFNALNGGWPTAARNRSADGSRTNSACPGRLCPRPSAVT